MYGMGVGMYTIYIRMQEGLTMNSAVIAEAKQAFIRSVQELEQQCPDLAALRNTPFGSDGDFDPERFMVAGDA